MIKSDKESPITCATCGGPAIRRVATVQFPGKGSANVAYDTHEESMTSSGWLAAVRRLEKFFERAYAIRAELRAMRDLPIGLIDFDFETIHPDACSKRTFLVILAEVRAFGLETEVKTKPMKLAQAKPEKILAELLPLVEEAKLRLKKRREEGDF